jgi:isocitrate dehydrogenase (NAD+)
VHGTAPDIAGKGIANPTAVMLAGVQLLEHIGERSAAEKLQEAIREAIASKEAVTGDLGGTATTRMFMHAVLKRLK